MKPHGITHAELELAGLPRRRLVNRLMELLATAAALVAVGVLGLMVYAIARRGAGALDLNLFTKGQSGAFSFTPQPRGLANAFVGSFVLVGLAAAMAVPIGILAAVYANEFARPALRAAVSFALDILNGIPAIVIGIFVFALVVVSHGQSAFAGAGALACLMLPLVARATQEVLALVPASSREASLALGVHRWRTVAFVVLPQTIGGILTGATLAIARAAGETAPLLFTSSLVGQSIQADPRHALQSVPVAIFELSESADPHDHAQAWAAALVLLVFILLASTLARVLASRSRRRIGLSR